MLTKSPILADKPGISVTASKSPPSTILLNHQQSSDHENKNETEYQKIITEFQVCFDVSFCLKRIRFRKFIFKRNKKFIIEK